MDIFWFFCFFFSFGSVFSYNFVTKYIDVPLDHFSFTCNATFKIRYLINDSYYETGGPIFFYTGNEGDISMFAENTGFMFDIAPKFNALLIFAEHRYYGTSLPFGNMSYSSPQKLGYLSASQALADFVLLIDNLKSTYGKNNNKVPVVAFGGSYGGMLSAWLRMKYPHSVVGAIASSAPIWQFAGLVQCQSFFKITTDVYSGLGGRKCKETIEKSWKIIRSTASSDAGKANLTNLLKLCNPLKTKDDIDTLLTWIENIYINLAMINYPYPTNFLNPVPANPVRAFCQKVQEDKSEDVLGVISRATTIYTNYTGQTKCNNITSSAPNLGDLGWDFQSCTQMIMPMCSKETDMFENRSWDFKKFSDDCYKKFSVRPRSERVPILEYGGKDIQTASNIVFSNGLLDPWSSGGVLRNISSSVFAILLPDGAHHLDLRGANPQDPGSVKLARSFHENQISRWLNQFYTGCYELEDCDLPYVTDVSSRQD